MDKKLIVVTGQKRSGKDTFGDYLTREHNYIKTQPLACFKPALKEWFGFSEEQMSGSLKETVDERWGCSPRQVMQVFGTELMREDLGKHLPKHALKVKENFWALVFKEWYLRQPEGSYVLCDWRFPEEQLILATLPNVTFVRINNNRCKNQDLHKSEKYIASMSVNYEIENNGTLQEYYSNIESIMEKELNCEN